MEKNNTSSTSNFSICKKIRQALATNPTFKAILRMKQFHHYQEPNPQNIKVANKESGGTIIPIVFDHSTPTSIGNGNSPAISSNSMVHGHASKVASPHVGISERKGKVVTKVEPEIPKVVMGYKKPTAETRGHNLKEHHGITGLVNLEQQEGKKTLDINDTFGEYIERAKNRIKTVSNVGRGQNNHHPVPDEVNKMENQKDHFSEFIQQAKKKIRTTSNLGKASSLKRA